ncbi:hypothetical protein AZL_013030 [Azospirillum sp. B510]|uniref:hypothetical protein n=1 Tax=Azospirillum sp. (strain B510) TaxID=137722 RepID=UPI0001C4C261|nr:hypothetical protein [Azospirillum sp. B510]BAI71941.1 hypothetical protein AZL_013030 [Azospirillum sp. B510]
MLLPFQSDHFRTAPPLGSSGHRASGPGDHPLRTVDCVTAALLFLVAVLLALLVFTGWEGLTAGSRPQAYENTPVLVIPPHPR